MKLINYLFQIGRDIPQSALTKTQAYNIKVLSLGLLFTTFGGALRKWGFGGSALSNVVLFVQLILPFILFSLYQGCKYKPATIFILIIYSLLLFAQAVNPLNQTLYHGVFGIFLHLGIWLLLFQYVDNIDQFPIEKLIPLCIVLLAVQIGLGSIQYSLPPSHFLNQYANVEEKIISEMGTGVRVTGTFSYLSGYSAFIFGWNLIIWAIFLLRFPAWVGYGGILFGILGALMSGSRASVALAIILGVVALLSNLSGKKLISRIIGLSISGLFMLSIAFQTHFVQTAIENFMTRVTGNIESGESNLRTVGVIEEVINFKGKYAFFGVGLGSTYQGSNKIWGESIFLKQYGGYEEEPERIILEGGLLLFFFRFGLFAYLLHRMKIPILPFLILIVLMFISMPIVFNVFNAFYFYFGIILVDRAYRIAKYKL
jgi:hypothetical protein